MPIFTALSTFEQKPLEKAGKCRACGKEHAAGALTLWKNCTGRFGKARLILCDEKCHADYDQSFWEARADKSVLEERRSRQSRIYKKAESEGCGYSTSLVTSAREGELEEIEAGEERFALENYEI